VFPVKFILPVILGKYTILNMEMKLFMVAFLVKFLDTISMLLTGECGEYDDFGCGLCVFE